MGIGERMGTIRTRVGEQFLQAKEFFASKCNKAALCVLGAAASMGTLGLGHALPVHAQAIYEDPTIGPSVETIDPAALINNKSLELNPLFFSRNKGAQLAKCAENNLTQISNISPLSPTTTDPWLASFDRELRVKNFTGEAYHTLACWAKNTDPSWLKNKQFSGFIGEFSERIAKYAVKEGVTDLGKLQVSEELLAELKPLLDSQSEGEPLYEKLLKILADPTITEEKMKEKLQKLFPSVGSNRPKTQAESTPIDNNDTNKDLNLWAVEAAGLVNVGFIAYYLIKQVMSYSKQNKHSYPPYLTPEELEYQKTRESEFNKKVGI